MNYEWYIIHTSSGAERQVKKAILEQAEKSGMSEYFEEVLIPAVDVIETRRGKEVNMQRSFLPGYVLIKMCMTDDAWHLVKSFAKVSGFLGSGGKPSPVPEREVRVILDRMQNTAPVMHRGIMYEVGESVKVLEGPFESFTGVVEDVDSDKNMLRISVSILGRVTGIDLSFQQVEKI